MKKIKFLIALALVMVCVGATTWKAQRQNAVLIPSLIDDVEAVAGCESASGYDLNKY